MVMGTLCVLAAMSIGGGLINIHRNRWQKFVDPNLGGRVPAQDGMEESFGMAGAGS